MSIETVDPARPTFGPQTAIAWLLYPAIHLALRGSRRPDGTYPHWVCALPNQLTLSRLLALPLAALFAWSIISGWKLAAGLLLVGIVLMLLTDAVDGAVARYAHVGSPWGQTWDAVLDKIATAALLASWLVIVYHVQNSLFVPLLILVLIRIAMDLILAAVARTETSRGLQPRARTWGKIKATSDCVAILIGFTSQLVGAYGHIGHAGSLAAIGFLSVSCVLAPMSIYEHAANLFRPLAR